MGVFMHLNGFTIFVYEINFIFAAATTRHIQKKRQIPNIGILEAFLISLEVLFWTFSAFSTLPLDGFPFQPKRFLDAQHVQGLRGLCPKATTYHDCVWGWIGGAGCSLISGIFSTTRWCVKGTDSNYTMTPIRLPNILDMEDEQMWVFSSELWNKKNPWFLFFLLYGWCYLGSSNSWEMWRFS